VTGKAGDRRADERELEDRVDEQVRRLERAERERRTVLGDTIYLGTLGLLFILPVVLGAYVGRWLDELLRGYSIRWTLSLIFLGIILGAVNVYLFIRE
jgi:ATP synthase protein I